MPGSAPGGSGEPDAAALRRTWFAVAGLLVLAAVLRLPFVDSPPLSWRQADNASIARNYYRNGMRFLRPQIDWAGRAPGIVQSEFPAYQYGVAVLYAATGGVREWWGRVVSIAAALAAILALVALVRDLAGPRAALAAGLAFAVLPQWVSLSRAIRVEAPLVLACVAAVLGFRRWLAGRGRGWLVLAVAAAAAAGLLKVIALLHLAFPFVFLAWHRYGRGAARRPSLWIAAVAIAVPALAWYGWSDTLLRAEGNSLFGDWRAGTDKWGNWGMACSWEFWNRIVFQRVTEKHLTWPGLVLAVGGVFAAGRSRESRVLEWWLAGLAAYSAVVTNGSWVHEHYQVPFVIPAAALMGIGLASFRAPCWLKGTVLAAFLAMAGWRAWAMEVWAENPATSPAVRLAAAVRDASRPGDLIVAVWDNNPMLLYLADRKGWVAGGADLRNGTVARRLRDGAVLVAGTRAWLKAPGDRDALDRFLARRRILLDDGVLFLAR